MDIAGRLKDIYFSLEDKWYAFVDKVSDKVPQFGKLIDKIEEKNIPSFPLAMGIVAVIIILIALVLLMNAGSSLMIGAVDGSGNPVIGATVSIYLEDSLKESRQTDDGGKAAFFLPNGNYTAKVEKEGFVTATRGVAVPGNEEILTLTPEDLTISKVVALKTASGQLITGSGTLRYSCVGSDEEKVAYYTEGKFTAEVDRSCTEIEVDSISGYRLVTARASFAGANEVIVEQQSADTGTAIVNISASASGTAVPPGLRVSVVAEDGVPAKTDVSGTGTVVFSSIPTKRYYAAVTDPAGNFAPYDGKALGEIKELAKDATITFNVKLDRTNSSKIVVNVRDALSSSPIKGAEVKMLLSANTDIVVTKITGETGQVEFDAADSTSYRISAEHPEYIIAEAKSVAASFLSPQTVDIFLVKATSENSQSLLVKVTDMEGKPVDSAKVSIKTLADDVPITDMVTGADGTAEFFNIDLGTYYAYVAKNAFEKISQTVQILPRRQNTLEVKMQIGKGAVKIKVLDSENAPLRGATVKAVNYYTAKIEEQKSSSAEGLAEFSIRADKTVYFTVEHPDYVKYNTVALAADEGSTKEKEVVMVKGTGRLSAAIVGLFAGNSAVSSLGGARSVSQGTYTVKALLVVPGGAFSEAGMHLRTGKAVDGITNLMEEDTVYIGGVASSATKTIKGTTFTPPGGYDKDSKNLTTGNAKWANIVWRNAQEGAYEIEAQITVTETDPNAGINLWYRGWAKGASMLRDPASTGAQNELYSSAKNYLLSAGATNLCAGSFCRSYVLKTITGSDAGKTQYVSNRFSAKKDASYVLMADLTNYSGRALSGAVLSIEGKGLDINGIVVNGTEHSEKTISLGNLDADAFTRLQIAFTASAAGTESIRLTISSSSKTEMEETITVNVKANKKLALDVLPLQIIPYIDNTMFFTATDGNSPVEGVIIEVSKNGAVLNTAETNGEGIAQYALSMPSIGDAVTIAAKKEGYDAVEITKKVNDSLLMVTPPSISETIKIGAVSEVTEGIVLTNQTVKDLEISSVDFSSDLKTYLTLDAGSIKGATVKAGKDQNFTLSIKPNSTAKKLAEPKTVKGTMTFTAKISGVSQTFTSKIDMDIRLSMPGFLDSDKCLKVTPSALDFVASSAEISKTVEIENTCTAEGIEVPMHELSVKLSEAAKYGTIMVSGAVAGSATANETYSKMADFFGAKAKDTLTVKFVPGSSAATGTQEFTLTFRATNVAGEDEKETVETGVKLATSMSNLSKCVTIEQPSGGVVIDVAPMNSGYNRIMMSSMASYAQQYQGFSSRGSYPFGMGGASMPFSGYGQNAAGMGGSGASPAYEQNSFIIKNSCLVDVEIDLDADSRITVSENNFTMGADSDSTVLVSPGYTLGKYGIKVNAKVAGTNEAKKKVGNVSVLVRRLGDIDDGCIKVNVTTISLNSFVYRPQSYKVFNYCYDAGVYLTRDNRAVSIQCDAPNASNSMYGGSPDVSYFQTGAEYGGLYGGAYPLGGAYSTYNSYLSLAGDGCSNSSCAMITGTRTLNRSVSQGDSGSIETLDFQVMPNAGYIPQRKLFDSRKGSYGLFNSLGDIRQWATDTDSRTSVYGNLNVQYTNAYGSAQCKTFPVTVEDQWRIGESIDSAINWGDPDAAPEECVNKDALDIRQYWTKKGVPSGAIPEMQYVGKNYMHIAQPPALNIGPAPSTSYYPQTSADYYGYYGTNAQTSRTQQGSAKAKNCGLMDSISNIKPSSFEAGGVKVTVEATTSGSLLKNKYGSNLSVQIDRSGITGNCVYIEQQVTATVRRTISFESAEVGWSLKALVIRAGYKLDLAGLSEADMMAKIKDNCQVNTTALTDCEQLIRAEWQKQASNAQATGDTVLDAVAKAKPECRAFYTQEGVTRMKPAAATAGACTNKANDYGFQYMTKAGQLTQTELQTGDYCLKNYCSNDQLQAFLLARYKQITEKMKGISVSSNNGKLSELYKEAETIGVHGCYASKAYNFYTGETGLLVSEEYALTDEQLTVSGDNKRNSIINGLSASSAAPISDMGAVLNKLLNSPDMEKYLLRIEKNAAFSDADWRNMFITDSDSKYMYMLPDIYRELNEGVSGNFAACSVKGADCEVTMCEEDRTIEPAMMEWIAGHSKLVKAIPSDSAQGLTAEEIEKVYVANPKLAAIHALAVFDADKKKTNSANSEEAMVAGIAAFKPIETGPFDTLGLASVKNAKLKFIDTAGAEKKSIEVGKYKLELDYNYSAAKPEEADVNVIIGSEVAVSDAPKAKQNVLLKNGLAAATSTSLENSAAGTIVEASGSSPQGASGAVFYERAPMKIALTLFAGETMIKYKPVPAQAGASVSTSANLIAWNDSGTKASETKDASGIFTAKIAPSQAAKSVTGIFYCPKTAHLQFYAGSAGGNGSAAEVAIAGTGQETISLPTGTSTSLAQFTDNAAQPTLDKIIELAKAQKYVCVDDSRIFWNETELLK